MCGITGIVYREQGRACEGSLVVSMRDIMTHRGPDAAGVFAEGNVGLGHRRLSIIDLSGGHQPMSNEDETVWIAYNGEIYNFRELREDLVRKGHSFRTKSDTEVILHLYEEKGDDCVNYLNGMFAFAIWDKKEGRLLLARDRMGIKPLYYAETPEGLVFSSEIKSIFESRLVRAQCNDEAVFEFFAFRHISGDRTMFRGVRSLMPGHVLSYQSGSARTRRYWSPYQPERERLSFGEAVERTSDLLHDAVRIRLVSDVPLGTFCSGGIDSSLITAIAAKYATGTLNTFSVGFHESDYDETSHARTVSERFGTTHHEIRLDNKEFAGLLPRLVWHNDEPLNFANSVQMFAICKLAKEFVTVVLTGEGSDELFAGYPRYLIPKLMDRYRRSPALFRMLMDAGMGLLKDHRADKFKSFASLPMSDALIYNSSFLGKEFLLEALACKAEAVFPFREQCVAEGESLGLDPVSNLSVLDQQNYLVSILMRQDKMSMAASIESRVPFLDYRLVELANRLPCGYKLSLLHRKRIIKQVSRKILPDSIIDRKKSGFGVPLDRWFRDDAGLGGLVGELGSSRRLSRYIDPARLKAVISEHRAGVRDHADFLWTALNFDLWLDAFGL